MKRLVKLTLLAGAIAGVVIVARKLMGGLGPQPGAPDAPKEWPSLVPEPPAPEASSGNGVGGDAGRATDTAGTAPEAATDQRITPMEDSGPNS